MLKAVYLKNFVLFKEHQALEFDEGVNFCVGSNGSGKSSLFELIRRCLSSAWNLSSSNIYDKTEPAFIICKYTLQNGLAEEFKSELRLNFVPTEISACRIAKRMNDHGLEKHFKVVLLKTDSEVVCFQDLFEITPSKNEDVHFKRKAKCDDSDVFGKRINECTEKLKMSHCKTTDVSFLFEILEGLGWIEDLSSSTCKCEECLLLLTKSVAQIFGKRSIDQTQWPEGSNRQKDAIYDQISDRAQILDKLLDSSEDIDVQKEEEYFNALTIPLKYKFEKTSDGSITVTNLSIHCQTSLIKTSDGVVESKQLSLLFACKSYHTIILDDIERAMHPQMVRNLRELVLRRIIDKTVIVASNTPGLICSWTVPRTFVYTLKRNKELRRSCETRISRISDEIQKLMFNEDMRKVLFCSYVLFVEGIADKMVMYSVLHNVESILATGDTEGVLEIISKKDKFRTFLIGLFIVPQNGKTSHNNTKRFCSQIGVECMYLYDKDTFIDGKGGVKPNLEVNYGVEIQNLKQINKSLEEKNIFMWKHGSIENVVYAEDYVKDRKRKRLRKEEEKSTQACQTVACPTSSPKAEAFEEKKQQQKQTESLQPKKICDLSPSELDETTKQLIADTNPEIRRFLQFLEHMSEKVYF